MKNKNKTIIIRRWGWVEKTIRPYALRPDRLEKTTRRYGLVLINKTKRNIHCLISYLFGNQNTLWSIRKGQIWKKSKKENVIDKVLHAIIWKLQALSLNRLVLKFRGSMIGRQYIYKTFVKYNRFKIILFKFNPVIAHNGCRAWKIRRI